VLDQVRTALAIPPEKFLTNFHVRGNTSSASIPSVLDDRTADGTIKDGDLVLSMAMGAGWYYAGMLFQR
jgi:3-oxoacyl-[acyl-carrier-protein] synthase-3